MTTNDRIDEIAAETSIMLSDCGQPIYLAPGAPAAQTIRDAIDAIEAMGRAADTTRHADYTHVTDGLTEIEVSDDGDWTLYDTPIGGIDTSSYRGRSIAGAIEAGDMAAGNRYGALLTLLRAGDYADTRWEDMVTELTDLQIMSGDGGTRVRARGGEHAGVVVTECGGYWAIIDLETMCRSTAASRITVAATVIDTIY